MHRLGLVRGINTKEDDHGKGAVIMHTGRRPDPAVQYPQLGSAMAKLLGSADSALPGYIHVTPGGGGGFNKSDAGFLGPRFASVTLGDGKPPANLLRPDSLSAAADQDRQTMRERLDHRFMQPRKSTETEVYTQSYDQAAQLMQQASLFDVSKESPHMADFYGRHEFGRHCLLARRLLNRASPSSRSRIRTTTRITKTSTSTSSNWGNSTGRLLL